MVLSCSAVGAWALAATRAQALNVPALWWATAAAYGSVFAQILIGFALLGSIEGPAPSFHVLYGVSAAFSVAVLYGYRNQLAARRLLIFGLGSLFIAGLSIRAMIV